MFFNLSTQHERTEFINGEKLYKTLTDHTHETISIELYYSLNVCGGCRSYPVGNAAIIRTSDSSIFSRIQSKHSDLEVIACRLSEYTALIFPFACECLSDIKYDLIVREIAKRLKLKQSSILPASFDIRQAILTIPANTKILHIEGRQFSPEVDNY